MKNRETNTVRPTKRGIPSSKQPTPRPVYGQELILDLHGCDNRKFTRGDIEQFCRELCDLIDMETLQPLLLG